MKPQRVHISHHLEVNFTMMHVLLKGKGVEKKVCASSIFADIIRVCKTICGGFLD